MSDVTSTLDLPDGPLRRVYQSLCVLFVVTRRHGTALEAMLRLFRASPYSSSHQGFALFGESGAGKTSTLRRLKAELRRLLGLTDTDPDPLPCISVTATMTPKDLMVELLKACGDLVPSSGTRAELVARFKALAPHVTGIRGLALDEAHHAFEAKNGKEKVQMALTLKDVVSAFPKPIIVLGPMVLEQYLDAADGMPMRFERREFLEDMRLDLTDDLHDLRLVLQAMDALLPSEPGWALDSQEMLKRLYLAGRASFGRIVTLVQRACLHALMAGAVQVGPAHYSAAWLEAAPRRQRSDKHDPFKLDLATVTKLAAQLCTEVRERG
jgi:hypothetical protein